MKRVAVAAATALLCLACGDSSDKPEQNAGFEPRGAAAAPNAGANGAPVLDSATLSPSNASAGDALAVEIRVEDPDDDRLTMTYEWYRNGELVPELHDSYAPAGSFARGERVHAVVYASDRLHQVSLQTNDLTIQNAPPRVDNVTLTPARPSGLDLIEAVASGHDADQDDFTYEYRWIKNGQPIAGATGSRLEPGQVKRGDQLSVQVVARDSDDTGPAVASSPITIQNASPQITSQPVYELGASGHYTYEVAAKDPDGDEPLRYELSEAPPGMVVDVTSGRVTWNVPADAKGTYQIELAVSDGYGGRTTQNYALALDWNDTPASASDKQPAKRGEAGSPAKKATGKETPAARAKAAPAKKAKPSDEDDTESDQDQEQNEGEGEEQF